MSSPEVEGFEVTEDDLLDELNPNRRRFRQSKNKATYGIWSVDSDEEDKRPRFKGGGNAGGSYASGINFISGGFKAASKMPVDSELLERGPKDDRFSDSDEDAPPPPPKMSRRGGKNEKPFFLKHQNASDIGDWERHTRGIGAKLLGKMGHVVGKGLGKDLQGITTPVEAKLRKGKAAIGYYGSERVPSKLPQAPIQIDSEEEEEREFQQQMQQWRKDGSVSKQKPKYRYKTADDLLAGKNAGRGLNRHKENQLSNVKVIDMTGKEQRVMSGYHALALKHDKPDDSPRPMDNSAKRSFDLPELIHNLDLLVNMSEEEIISNNRRVQYERDLEVNLEHESNKLTDICLREEKEVKRLQNVFEVIEECERRMAQDCMDALGVDECVGIFRRLQRDYAQEYHMYNLSAMAVAVGIPLMKRELESWKPLKHPHLCHAVMLEWKSLLQNTSPAVKSSKNGNSMVQMDTYDRMVWDVVMPHIRVMTLDSWHVKECDQIIHFLELWQPLLPSWVIDNIADQLIMPRLQKGVESWNPTQDTVPIDHWIHPWLPFLSDRLEPLYGPIRHKLANALKGWHPSDPSAKMILQPWVPVFQKGHMNGFVCTNILPKLNLVLSEFEINPQKQQLEPWMWVMSWQDMMPQSSLLALLNKHFFPKWHQVLSTWLNNKPNYEEVSNWYKGWKAMLSEDLVATSQVKEQLNIALTMMDRAVSGTLPPGTSAYLTNRDRSSPKNKDTPPLQPPPLPPSMATTSRDSYRSANYSSGMPESFKDLVARRAEELGILFMPIPNKTFEAKPVYRFGSEQVCIDRSVIFRNTHDKGWIPTSLNAVLESQKR